MAQSYRIPKIEVNDRQELVRILSENPPLCIFEYIEEVSNPVGLQWNLELTTRVESENLGLVIISYNEDLFKLPVLVNNVFAVWLREKLPYVCWYKGRIIP